MRLKANLFIIIVIYGLIFLIVSIYYKHNNTIKYLDSSTYKETDTLTINFGESFQIPWNYVNTSTDIVETFSSSVFGSLIDVNNQQSDSNSLVHDYNCKLKKCTINLKNFIKFHNNRIVTAYDVEFSYIRFLVTKNEDNFASSILDDIEGIENLQNPLYKTINSLVYPTNVLKGFRVINEFQIELTLKRENQFLLQKLSTGFLPIVPIEELKENLVDWIKLPVGFGRYKVIKANLENHYIILKKNTKENIPKYIRIIFSKDDIGDIKLLSHNDQTTFDGITILNNIYVNAGFLFNFKNELGSNNNFRSAISFALDREKIAETALHNDLIAEDQLLARYTWQDRYRARENFTQKNIDLAKENLKKIPEKLWKNKIIDVYTFWPTIGDLNNKDYIKEIKRQLAEIGINLQFHNTDPNYTKFKKDDENVLWFTGFDTQTDDPNANFAYFKAGSFFNNIYPENDKEFLQLYELSVNNFLSNPEHTRNLSEYFKKKNYMVVIFNVKKRFAYRKDRIEFLESEYSGVRLDLWKIKLLDFKLF